MDHFHPIWKQTKISSTTLAAIEDSEGNDLLAPNSEFGDPQSDLVKFQIPKFQRGLRWSKRKRDEFLGSVREGRPTGSLVFARSENSSGSSTKTWYVLDGQQRIAAFSLIIKQFWANNSYIADVHHLKELSQILLSSEMDFERLQLSLDTVCGKAGFGQKSLTNPMGFLAEWCDATEGLLFPGDDDTKNLAIEVTSKITDDLRNQYKDLKNYPIPALLVIPPKEYSSSQNRELITVIFQNLNNNTPLKANELLAAQWEMHLVQWEPELSSSQPDFLAALLEIMEERITKSYKDKDGDWEYIPNIEIISEENISFFDLFYSLSIASSLHYGAGEKKKKVFCLGTDGGQTDEELAFDTFKLFLTGSLGGNNEAFEDFLTERKKTFQFDQYQKADVSFCIDAYMTCTASIDSALTDTSSFNNVSHNKRTVGKVACAAYLANLLRLLYNNQFLPRKEEVAATGEQHKISSLKKSWKNCLKSWWLRDILAKEFIGSDAYKNASNRVGGGSLPALPPLSMCSPPGLDELTRLLVDTFCDEYILPTGKTPVHRNASSATRALMHLICGSYPNQDVKVDFDHLIPWKKRGGYFPKIADPLPLNHPANYMPIASGLNRKRGNKSWKDFIDSGAVTSRKEREFIEKWLLLPLDEFTDSVREDKNKYFQFLIKRWVLISDRALCEVYDATGDTDIWGGKPAEKRIDLLKETLIEPILNQLQAQVEAFEPDDCTPPLECF
jgi:hypothetical protein